MLDGMVLNIIEDPLIFSSSNHGADFENANYHVLI